MERKKSGNEAEKQIVMTFEEYDELKQDVNEYSLTDGNCWPTTKEIEVAFNDPNIDGKRYLIFLDWLLENNEPPSTLDEKYSYQAIKDFLCQHLTLR